MKECIWIDWRSPKVQAVCCVLVVLLSFMVFCTHHVVRTIYVGCDKYPKAFRGLEFDAYADLVKGAVAHQKSVDQFLESHCDRADRWPLRFQRYLYINEYRSWGTKLTSGEPVPLSAALTSAWRFSLFRMGPVGLITTLFGVWGLLVALCARAVAREPSFGTASAIVIAGMFAFSWPALFMYQRGHVSSGVSAISALGYVLLRAKDRPKWLPFLLLGVAINLRPQYCAFGLIEVAKATSLRSWMASTARIAIVALVIMFASYTLTQWSMPDYHVSNFSDYFRNYEKLYISGRWGIDFGVSLLGFVRLMCSKVTLLIPMERFIKLISSITGLIVAISATFFVARRRFGYVETVFIAAAITVLFCPVTAVYHLLSMVIPLALCMTNDSAARPGGSRLLMVLASTAALVCYPGSMLAGFIVPPVLFIVLLVLLWRAATRGAMCGRDSEARLGRPAFPMSPH